MKGRQQAREEEDKENLDVAPSPKRGSISRDNVAVNLMSVVDDSSNLEGNHCDNEKPGGFQMSLI